MTTQAYFLVAHGSRSPHPKAALQSLADFVATTAQDDSVSAIGTGFLEFQPLSLAEQLLKFQASLPASCTQIIVIPVFLLPGHHVLSDIPDEIKIAQARLAKRHSPTQFLLTSHVGSQPAIEQILRLKMESLSPDAWILLGHGSRRSAGNQAIRQLANKIQAAPAFWAVEPSLSIQVQYALNTGATSIGIIPYFLFSGKITETIAQHVKALATQYSDQSLTLLSPLEPTLPLAAAILELAHLTTLDYSAASMARVS